MHPAPIEAAVGNQIMLNQRHQPHGKRLDHALQIGGAGQSGMQLIDLFQPLRLAAVTIKLHHKMIQINRPGHFRVGERNGSVHGNGSFRWKACLPVFFAIFMPKNRNILSRNLAQ
ncbi:MAG: hypothetical protein A2505_06635 [Deltaproteobacteria bacterium RIFOXYD12_FULL_55_16]|nr:MAG: hypothetical protein A2505_06635 [Deltaproteobacteria bacterium RIFOXYD12_FULL_55_16]